MELTQEQVKKQMEFTQEQIKEQLEFTGDLVKKQLNLQENSQEDQKKKLKDP